LTTLPSPKKITNLKKNDPMHTPSVKVSINMKMTGDLTNKTNKYFIITD
jgi:hypothetical protein